MIKLISELQRRGVFKVAAAYAFGAWILIESGSVIFPVFGASESFVRGYVIFVAIGFLASLLLAWFYHFSEGRLHREVSAEQSHITGDQDGESRRAIPVLVVTLVAALCISIALNILGSRNPIVSDSVADDSSSIAVLPFTNISNDPSDTIFVDGIHDDLLTKLANVNALRVISRTSVLMYRGTNKNMRDIGRELGAQHILEGSVRRVGDNIRINMQLINASNDEHLWAQTYDRELTAKNIFDIQSEISTQIAGALKATLSDSEWDRVHTVPTENIEAYRLFVSGRQNLHQRRFSTTQSARTQFQQAIELDPNYADAYVGLADAVLLLHINHNDIPEAEALRDSQLSIDKALQLNPSHPDAFATQGLIYMQQSMTDPQARARAEESFKLALKLNPSNARAWMWYSTLEQDIGDYERALEYNKKSLSLDPIGRIPYLNIGKLLSALDRNEEATQEFAKGIELHPDWPSIYMSMSIHLQRLGRVDEGIAWTVLASSLNDKQFTDTNLIGAQIELGQSELALKAIENIADDDPLKGLFEAYVHVLQGEPKIALESIEKFYAGREEILPMLSTIKSDVALMAGDLDASRKYLLESHPEFNEREITVDDMNASAVLKLAYLTLQSGDQSSAQNLLNEVLSITSNQTRLGVAGHGIRDVQALALLGRTEEAISAFKQAVSAGYISSLSFDGFELSKDVYLRSIQNDPEFVEQVEIINHRITSMRERVETAQSTGDWESLRAIALDD